MTHNASQAVYFFNYITLGLTTQYITLPETTGNISEWGAFGYFVGGIINPLLQLIVITMLLWSIQVQREELHATRDTLDATKDELEETKEANKRQAHSLEEQVKFYKTKNELDNIKKEIESADNKLNLLLNFDLSWTSSVLRRMPYTLNQVLWGANQAAEDIIKDLVKNKANDELKSMGLSHASSEFIVLSNEYIYCFKELERLEEYEYCIAKLFRFILLYQKVVALGLLPMRDANHLAQFTENLAYSFPDLKNEHLSRLKTLAAEESQKILNYYTSQH